MPLSFNAGVRDSLFNLAASLGVGKDKAAHDAFTVFDLGRAQVEAMYRGDWLARKVVDIVPYDSVRAWRSWSGPRADVARFEAAERRLGLRKAVQRAMVLGRLYGGGAILIGDGETDVAKLARPLDPRLPRGGLAYLHVVSRWQLGVTETELNPLSPWCGEPKSYTLSSPGLPPLELHPSRVVRFLGNPLPDPSLAGALWSDSVLQSLYDAVHAAALSLAGATSLLHEAKVDVVTVPNLSEHLSSAETTEQLSARFAYAAAMKSMNNLLLLGDGESWSRQSVDFAGLPEMARTFLQVAAGAADIPVTRLLGQSPAGLSATGESDVRNYYDMIAARQELDLRPQLERLDRLICWSEDIDEGALSFAFRPLWQLDEPSKAALALTRAQTTQIYAGLKLWPDAVMARLVEAQFVADGTYPNNAAVFAEQAAEVVTDAREVGAIPRASGEFWPEGKEPRDWHGRWTVAGGGAPSRDPPLVRVAQNDPIAGGNSDIDQKIDEEQKQQGHSSELFPHPNSENPSEVVRAALQPFGAAGAGGKIQLPPVAGAVVKPNAPLVLPAPRIVGVPSPSGTQSSSGRSAIQAGPNSPAYFPEFEDSSIYKFFRDRFTALPDELAALKSQMPEDIARHMIDGFIGPGPFAQDPIKLGPIGKITDETFDENDFTGYGFGCHKCGTLEPGTDNGHFILDHQLHKGVNFGNWTFSFLSTLRVLYVAAGRSRPCRKKASQTRRFHPMNLLDLDGGPLLCIDRMSLSQWGGVFRSSFFGSESTSANDYEEMCKRLSRRKSENLSLVKGVNAEALLIGIPLPTLIVEADGSSVYLVQIWSSEQGWSESSLTMDDFRSAADWRGDVRFFCGGGEFVIFDSSCSHEDIEGHFSIYLERGMYRCESCHQKRKGQAEIVLISMLKQA